MCGVSLRISCQRSDLDISSVIFELNGVMTIDGPSTEAEQRYIFGDPVVGRRERSFACATRAPRDTPALGDHGLHAALGCRCRGVDSASRSSILSTAKPVRGAGASEPDKHIVHVLVGCRGPAAAGRHRGCGAETGMRALSRSRAGVHGPSHVAGSRGTGTAAVVRCGTGPTERARCFPPISGFSRAALARSRA